MDDTTFLSNSQESTNSNLFGSASSAALSLTQSSSNSCFSSMYDSYSSSSNLISMGSCPSSSSFSSEMEASDGDTVSIQSNSEATQSCTSENDETPEQCGSLLFEDAENSTSSVHSDHSEDVVYVNTFFEYEDNPTNANDVTGPKNSGYHFLSGDNAFNLGAPPFPLKLGNINDRIMRHSPGKMQIDEERSEADIYSATPEKEDADANIPMIFTEETNENDLFAEDIIIQGNITEEIDMDVPHNTSESLEESNLPGKSKIIIGKIEDLVLSLLKDLVEGNRLMFKIRKTTEENCQLQNDKLTVKSDLVYKKIEYKTHKKINNKFVVMFHILCEIHHLLVTGGSCTKREIYYNDPDLTQNQAYVNLIVNDICNLLDASETDLGIIPRSKGLIVGDLKCTTSDNEVVNFNCVDGLLVPSQISMLKDIQSTAKFILLVEKDTVFRKLLENDIFKSLGKEMIMITGKGYPDINTRLILKKLWEQFKIPIYALIDADPHGIEIMLTYKHGSRAMSHNSDDLAVPAIKWLGIYPSDVAIFNIPSVPLTSRDKSKLNSIMKRPYINEKMKTELVYMQTLKQKCEIEEVAGMRARYLVDDYIPSKLYNKNLI